MYRKLLLPIALGQFLAPALPALTGLGEPVGARARVDYGGLPPEQPIGIAFSIWGVIFLFYLLFALTAWRKETELTRRVVRPLALAGAFNIVWMLAAQFLDVQLLNYALLYPIMLFAWSSAAAFDSVRGMGGGADKFFADAATGLLSGWIMAAVSISLPLTLRAVSPLGASDAPWQMLLLTLTAALTGGVLFYKRISRSLWFYAALGWGVFCIALNNWIVTGMHPMAVMSLLAGVWLVVWRLTRDAKHSMAAA